MNLNMLPLRCRQVFDDEHARAFRHIAFDLGIAAMALRLLADIDHRQAETICQQGGEGDA